MCYTREHSDGQGVVSEAGGDRALLGTLHRDEGSRSCVVLLSDAGYAKMYCYCGSGQGSYYLSVLNVHFSINRI